MSVETIIKSDWDSVPDMARTCLNILRSLKKVSSYPEHYTFRDLAKLSKSNNEELVSKALLYLATPKIKILKTCLMYEWNGFFHDLPEEQIKLYSKGQQVIHPEIGEPMDSSQILICFSPGDKLVRGESS